MAGVGSGVGKYSSSASESGISGLTFAIIQHSRIFRRNVHGENCLENKRPQINAGYQAPVVGQTVRFATTEEFRCFSHKMLSPYILLCRYLCWLARLYISGLLVGSYACQRAVY